MKKLDNQDLKTFADLSNDELSVLKKAFDFRKYRKGDFIIRERDTVVAIYMVISGLLKLSYTDRQAKEYILSFASEGWWESDFSAFYFGNRAILTLECLEDTEVYILTKDKYTGLINHFPRLAQYFLDKSIKGHIADQKRILSLLNLTPKERYEQFLQSYPFLIHRIPKTILSSYLGVSRETLSRLYRSHTSSKK